MRFRQPVCKVVGVLSVDNINRQVAGESNQLAGARIGYDSNNLWC